MVDLLMVAGDRNSQTTPIGRMFGKPGVLLCMVCDDGQLFHRILIYLCLSRDWAMNGDSSGMLGS